MKFCQNCGAEMPDDGMFCTNCGTKVIDTTAQPVNPVTDQQPVNNSAPQQPVTNDAPQQQPVYNSAPQQPVYNNAPQQQPIPPQMAKPPKKPLSKKAKIIILCAVIVVIAAVVAIVCIIVHNKNKKETVNVMDFITVKYEGYNTIGTAKVDLDEDAFANEVLEAQGKDAISDDDLDDMDDIEDLADLLNGSSDYYDDMESIEDLIDCLDITVTPEDGLSNGDKVTVKVTYDEDIVDDNDIILKCEDTEFTVEGLSDIAEIDPFDYITVEFDGTAPNAYADVKVDNSQDVFNYIYYSIDKNDDLDIGDKVTISFDDDQVEYAANNGYKLTETSKEYTVENLDHYILDASKISDDTLKSMKKETEDALKEYFDDWDNYLGYKDLKYVGMYFLATKDSDSWYPNYIYIIYSANVSSKDNDFKDSTVYIPVQFSDLLEKKEGTQQYDTHDIQGCTDLEFGLWREVAGYTTEKDMYKELITDNSDSYTGTVVGDLSDGSKNSSEKESTSEEESTTVEETTTSEE